MSCFSANRIYINALVENPELGKVLMEYDAFTDIEFNPEKQVNCQARAAAVYVSLRSLGLIDQVKDPESFLSLYDLQPKHSAAASRPEKEKTAFGGII